MNRKTEPNINLSFIRGGHAHVGKAGTMFGHWCNCNKVSLENKFYLPICGEGELFINGVHYKLEKYKWFLIGEGEVRSYYTTGSNELEKYNIHFYSDAGIRTLKETLDLPDCIPLEEDEYEKAVRLMSIDIADYTLAPANLYDFFSNKSKLYKILSYYAELAAKKKLHKTNHNNSTSRIQLMVMQYISDSYMENTDIYKLADSLGMTESYFLKYFKKTFCISFNQLVYKRRWFVLIGQMLTTETSIKDLACRCGFKNESYFYRIFKEQFGMTPLQYRKKHTESEFFSIEQNFTVKKQKKLKDGEIYSFEIQ